MRVDKFLWSLRYFKTRTLATNACKKGHVKVNNKSIKASREVYPNEKLTIRKSQINYSLTIIDIPKTRVGSKLTDLYRVDTTPKSEFEVKKLSNLSKEYYIKKGSSRPTKKDRRDIEDYLSSEKY
jgi:ribosome-associated heat shock protein Hsp15|tara:strand:- start:163 stop:537 length:375 start_codon:yes stop_codon:yes gene_type:complete